MIDIVISQNRKRELYGIRTDIYSIKKRYPNVIKEEG